MKRIYIVFICLFFALLLTPMLFFNTEENAVSAIDNRMLAGDPFAPKEETAAPEEEDDVWGDGHWFDSAAATEERAASLTEKIESYLSDRIGFRDGMIRLYTNANDALFGLLVHPAYEYGKDGYIFFRTDGGGPYFWSYHQDYAAMVRKLQDYCEERGVPFLFVIDPLKNSVLRDELQDGIRFSNGWLGEFTALLDEYGVRYLDNTELMREKTEQGEAVYNVKYNAGHWNELGAFYGVNNILRQLQPDFPELRLNELSDFTITERLRTTLQNSDFSIYEYEPEFTLTAELENRTQDVAGGLRLDKRYAAFGDVIHAVRLEEGSPCALVFQGSYMNGFAIPFFENSLGEYIWVHDYQNVMNLDYYFQIFQPDCVVFETAEYVFSDEYYDRGKMQSMDLSPLLSSFELLSSAEYRIAEEDFRLEDGAGLTTLKLKELPESIRFVYLTAGGATYDLHSVERGYFSLTLKSEDFPDGRVLISLIDPETTLRYEAWIELPPND